MAQAERTSPEPTPGEGGRNYSPIRERYLTETAGSGTLHERAKQLLPGGTSRQAGFWMPYPLTYERAEGPFLYDVDGRQYFDLIYNYTAMVHGHGYPPIVEAAQRQAGIGTGWAGGNRLQLDLAEQMVDRIASVEQVRFTNSGTEANALAFTIARKVTGRSKLLMARFGYHGSLMEFECGSFGHEGPITRLAAYNDLTTFGKLIGGGFPVGAVGGQRDMLKIFDPDDLKLFHTGTFNANPVTMAAGGVSLAELTSERIDDMARRAEDLKTGLRAAAATAGLPLAINHHASLLNLYFSDTPPESSVVREDAELIGRFHLAAMNHGLFVAPRGLIAMSTVLTDAHIGEISERAAAAMADVAAETG